MSVHSSPLGKASEYVSQYSPQLLHPIARQLSRSALGLEADSLPFHGVDIWNGYELSWLNARGKPQVAVAEFRVPCGSPNIIESKSFKLYLNSLNQTAFASFEDVAQVLRKDLSAAAGADVEVALMPLTANSGPVRNQLLQIVGVEGECIDELDIDIQHYHPQPELLRADTSLAVAETLVSHLLKSNCPVTGQPDWASLIVQYQGAKIDREGLLAYLVSFREHQDFHEHCVERMFCDLLRQCQPHKLSVYARYTRRGGLDINPFRSTGAEPAVNLRLLRQ